MCKELDKYLSFTLSNKDCLEWTRALNTDGYPRAVVNGNYNGKVHRRVFELVNGYLPEVVRHSCDNPVCINPDHLLAGTHIDNVKDRVDRKRCQNHVSEKEISRVLELRAQGLTYPAISKAMGFKNWRRAEYILTQKVSKEV